LRRTAIPLLLLLAVGMTAIAVSAAPAPPPPARAGGPTGDHFGECHTLTNQLHVVLRGRQYRTLIPCPHIGSVSTATPRVCHRFWVDGDGFGNSWEYRRDESGRGEAADRVPHYRGPLHINKHFMIAERNSGLQQPKWIPLTQFLPNWGPNRVQVRVRNLVETLTLDSRERVPIPTGEYRLGFLWEVNYTVGGQRTPVHWWTLVSNTTTLTVSNPAPTPVPDPRSGGCPD
jgi:hypothetical protein